MSSTEAKIMILLQDSPQSSEQLAATLGYSTPKYVRRVLSDLCSRGKVSHRTDGYDGRTRIYYITTDFAVFPEVPLKESPHPESVPLSVPLNKIGEQIGEQIGEHFSESLKLNPAENPLNQKQSSMRHGDAPNAARSGECSPKNRGTDRGTLRGTDHVPLSPEDCDRACEACPLTLCHLEHDALQFGILDKPFARDVVNMAKAKGWERRQNPHTKVWTIRPNALKPVTLQVGIDSVTVYSSEPDMDWFVEWVGLIFAAIHPEPKRLLHKLQHPEIYRDEQTVVITEQDTILSIRAIIVPTQDYNHRDRTYWLLSPNAVTPGLKIYERDGTMRVEFDSRSRHQANAALVMRQEFLIAINEIARHPAKYLEWEGQYYRQKTTQMNVTVDNHEVAAAITELGQLMNTKIETVEQQLRSVIMEFVSMKQEETEKESEELRELIALVENMSDFELEKVVEALTNFTGSPDAAYVYLAAFALWAESRFKRSVLVEEVSQRLREAFTPIPLSRIAIAIDLLTEKGLLKSHPDRDIHFTKPATRLGKKLAFRDKCPEDV